MSNHKQRGRHRALAFLTTKDWTPSIDIDQWCEMQARRQIDDMDQSFFKWEGFAAKDRHPNTLEPLDEE